MVFPYILGHFWEDSRVLNPNRANSFFDYCCTILQNENNYWNWYTPEKTFVMDQRVVSPRYYVLLLDMDR